jgi:hypothetical protein
MNTHDGRKLSHEVLEAHRLRAIELRKMGKQVKEIGLFFWVEHAKTEVFAKIISLWRFI